MTREEREIAVKEFKEWRDSYYNKNKLPATMFIEEAIKALEQEPKMISLSVYEQIRWERDVAIEQLKELGYGLGEKPKTGHCKDCKHWKDSDGVYRRGVHAESECPINTKVVLDGDGYCYLFSKMSEVSE